MGVQYGMEYSCGRMLKCTYASRASCGQAWTGRVPGLQTGKDSRGELHRQHSNRIKKSERLLGKPHIWVQFIMVYR
jgi:hypothetical protein